MINDVEHLLMCLLAICIPSLKKCLLKSFACFLLELIICFLFFVFYKFMYLFIYLFLAALGLHCCAWAFSSCGKWELLFVVVHRLLTAVASLVVEHRL